MARKNKSSSNQSHINKQVRELNQKLYDADKLRHRFLVLGSIGSVIFLVLFIIGQIMLSAGIRIEEYPFVAWTSIVGLMVSAFGSMIMWARYARYKGECKNTKMEIRYYKEGWYKRANNEEFD